MLWLTIINCSWVILLILVNTRNYLLFLAIFHKLAANEQGLLPKTSKR